MASQSPVRNRKPVSINLQGPMQQSTVPREASPSPSFRERQRAAKSHSMPIVPSVSQILASAVPQNQQPSPTTSNSSHQSRRTPPPYVSYISNHRESY
ncbi:hypothetical protein QCA50_001206 [Cerrena zonata]|uniref:Uncharacterized protein n=1 Tax=Cerrena zonata TaxID=2478898 RepID=A0AAW0GT35_9APHY